ncbi:MAG: alpha/beta fold hydrolase, partial [Pseudomonadota bacterium]
MSRRLAAILSLDVVGYTDAMARDAPGTLAAVAALLRGVVRPELRARNGRLFKLMGDGALAIFDSAADAMTAAARIQQAAATQAGSLRLRAGVHAGDVTQDGDDVFGDAVNIAARLQAAAPPGGVLVSRLTADLAGGGHDAALHPKGMIRLKGVPRPVEALSVDLNGGRSEARLNRFAESQRIRFAASADGVRLAWTAIGEGAPLVKAPNWIQHLEEDWRTLNAGWMADLAERRRFIRFDQRGNGLSDRGEFELSAERFADDLEAVMIAAGVERVPVIAVSQGCPAACTLAARRPDLISGLIFIGGFAQGPLARSDAQHRELAELLNAMGRVGWDGEYPSIRDHFARILAPDASPDDQAVYAEHMRACITAEDFGRFREATGRIDVTDILPRVSCPTLVLHARGDRLQPPDQGRRLAAGIPDARFVAL